METIIYIAILSLTIVGFVTFIMAVSNARNKNSVVVEVQANSRQAMEIISQKIRTAAGVNVASSTFGTDPGVLSLSMNSGAKNPTVFNLNKNDGTLYMTEGNGNPVAITSNKVFLSNLMFNYYGSSRVASSSFDFNTIGLWHMNDASGDFLDFSGNAYNLNNQVGASVTYSQGGEFGTSVLFGSGSRSRYDVDCPKLKITDQLTIEAWVYETASPTDWEMIAGKWDDYTGANRGYTIGLDGSDHPVFFWSTNGYDWPSIFSDIVMPLNQWVHITGVYNKGNAYLFINGVLHGSGNSGTSIYQTPADFVIGDDQNWASSGTHHYFKGRIDEVRISDIARWTSNFTPPNSPYSETVIKNNGNIGINATFDYYNPTNAKDFSYSQSLRTDVSLRR